MEKVNNLSNIIKKVPVGIWTQETHSQPLELQWSKCSFIQQPDNLLAVLVNIYLIEFKLILLSIIQQNTF